MAPYKSGALMRSKYYTSFYKTPLKWIPRSKSGASKSRPLLAAHTRIGNVWEYPPPGSMSSKSSPYSILYKLNNGESRYRLKLQSKSFSQELLYELHAKNCPMH